MLPPYIDRIDAGLVLARALSAHRDAQALVLALPRGGVPVAYEIAKTFGAELDVLVARKLGAPQMAELAIGAVTADGTRVFNEDIVRHLRVTPSYLDEVTRREQANAQDREAQLRGGLPPLDVEGRIAIVVDDGLATGATMLAAIAALRRNRPQRVIAAVPVGAPNTCRVIERAVDALVCPYRPNPFHSVGAYYAQFDQTSDEEVTAILRTHRNAHEHEHEHEHDAR